MNSQKIKEYIQAGSLDSRLQRVYANEKDMTAQRERYIGLVEDYEEIFGNDADLRFFSAPGRTEVCGNHTDHNRGKVLAAGINLDAVAVAAKNNDGIIRVKSRGYNMDVAEVDDMSIHEDETGHSASLVRGICAGFINNGYKVGGFDACTVSNVLAGSGLSSSAAFEVLLGTIMSYLYNDGQVDAVTIAKIAQYAENEYFGKPCGLMDQMASSVGSFVTIDFKDPKDPVIQDVPFDFASCGHSLCIVDTKGSHSDLTDDYAAIRGEMENVAAQFGKQVLRDVDEKEFISRIPEVRKACGDRAVLRASHFFNENKRVEAEVEALSNNDFETFKKLTLESGFSSYMYNQNVFSSKYPTVQPVSVALMISESVLKGRGAWRVHGGGFAGTIQAFVPNDLLETYKKKIEAVFGQDSCYVLSVRPVGGTEI